MDLYFGIFFVNEALRGMFDSVPVRETCPSSKYSAGAANILNPTRFFIFFSFCDFFSWQKRLGEGKRIAFHCLSNVVPVAT